MNTATINTMHECSVGSIENNMPFPDVVQRLAGAGVEFYHADLVRREKTYYLPDGETHVEAMAFAPGPIAECFSAEAVKNAVKSIQRGELTYIQFLHRIMDAGTTHYYVFLSGKRAVYSGRQGENYVEYFPQ